MLCQHLAFVGAMTAAVVELQHRPIAGDPSAAEGGAQVGETFQLADAGIVWLPPGVDSTGASHPWPPTHGYEQGGGEGNRKGTVGTHRRAAAALRHTAATRTPDLLVRPPFPVIPSGSRSPQRRAHARMPRTGIAAVNTTPRTCIAAEYCLHYRGFGNTASPHGSSSSSSPPPHTSSRSLSLPSSASLPSSSPRSECRWGTDRKSTRLNSSH